MTIQNQKDLSKLLDLCRKKGVDSIEIDNIKIKLGKSESKLGKFKAELPDLTSNYTQEDILTWSSTPLDGAF